MSKKALFISVDRGGISEEIVLEKSFGVAPDRLTVGNTPDCDIDVPVTRKHRLIKKSWSGLSLRLPESLEGEIEINGSALQLQGLIKSGLLKKNGGCFLFPFPKGNGFSITIGGATLAFGCKEIVSAQKKSAPGHLDSSLKRPLIRKDDYAFLRIFIILFVVNFSVAGYLRTVKIERKEAREVLKEMPARFAKLILQPPKKKVVAKALPQDAEDKQKKEEVKEDQPKKEAQREELEPRKEAHETQRAVKERVSARGLLGVITSKTKPLAVLDEKVFSEIDNVVENIGKSEIKKGGTDIILANLGPRSMNKAEELSQEIYKNPQRAEYKSSADILREKKDIQSKTDRKDRKEAAGSVKRDASAVYSTVVAYSGGLKYLYNNALKNNPSLKGKVTAMIVISQSGKVIRSELVSSTLGFPELEEAIIKRIHMWKFPESKGADDYTIEYIFDFAPVG